MELHTITEKMDIMTMSNSQIDTSDLESGMKNLEIDTDLTEMDTTELVKDVFNNDLDIYEAENRILCLGVPNVFCSKYFDDEDFVYSKIRLCKTIREKLFGQASITDYLETILTYQNMIIDYGNSELDLNVLYGKILYVFQYVNYYYVRLRYLAPQERLGHLPNDLPEWIENIVNIIKHHLDIELQHYIANLPQDKQYLQEIIYGLNLIVCHLKMILNHHRLIKASFIQMNTLHAEKMFRLTNNMCNIIIFANYISSNLV